MLIMEASYDMMTMGQKKNDMMTIEKRMTVDRGIASVSVNMIYAA